MNDNRDNGDNTCVCGKHEGCFNINEDFDDYEFCCYKMKKFLHEVK